MKYLLSLAAVAIWAVLSTGCVIDHETPTTTRTSRTTTVSGPLVPAASATTTTTTY